jgi:beta-fructofuranosidase
LVANWNWVHGQPKFDGPGFKSRTDYGWSGTMTLPRVLSLGADGSRRMNPPQEIEQLRYNGKQKTGLTVADGTDRPLS